MPATAAKMTVAEYAAMTPPAEGRWELRHGELVKVTFPKKLHNKLQLRLLNLLAAQLGPDWTVGFEIAFRPSGDHELWAADVAVISTVRWAVAEDWLSGAPEIVIEVLSPSNTASEMLDREKTCFEGGAREFWIVDPALSLVRISSPDGPTATYTPGRQIPLSIAPDATIAVDDIFHV